MSKLKKNTKELTYLEEWLEAKSPQGRAAYEKELHEFIISELVLAIMNKRDLSVRRLAQMADISPTIVQDIRSGKKHNLNLDTFIKILEAMRCSMEIVIGDDTPSKRAVRLPFSRRTLRSQRVVPYEVVTLPSRGRR